MALLHAFTTPWWYAGWFVVSAVALAGANYLDPYALAFAAMAALWITVALAVTGVLGALLAVRERGYAHVLVVICYAALSALPTLASLWVLSRIHWA